MRTATLSLSISPAERVVFSVRSDGPPFTVDGPGVRVAEKLDNELKEHEYSDAAQRARVLRRYTEDFDPPGLGAWFRQWISTPDDDSVLCVHADDARLSALPWEEMLLPTGTAPGRASVVRVFELSEDAPPAPVASMRMLLAG